MGIHKCNSCGKEKKKKTTKTKNFHKCDIRNVKFDPRLRRNSFLWKQTETQKPPTIILNKVINNTKISHLRFRAPCYSTRTRTNVIVYKENKKKTNTQKPARSRYCWKDLTRNTSTVRVTVKASQNNRRV